MLKAIYISIFVCLSFYKLQKSQQTAEKKVSTIKIKNPNQIKPSQAKLLPYKKENLIDMTLFQNFKPKIITTTGPDTPEKMGLIVGVTLEPNFSVTVANTGSKNHFPF